MVELLEARGFHLDDRTQPGNIHFENYWQPHKETPDVVHTKSLPAGKSP
jgi:hypothetical protein